MAKLLTYAGKSQTINEWANELGIPRKTIYTRLWRGYTVAQALGAETLPADETICWCCANSACSGCSWALDFTPVPGWDAEPTKIKAHTTQAGAVKIYEIDSYKVKQCPLFKPDR